MSIKFTIERVEPQVVSYNTFWGTKSVVVNQGEWKAKIQCDLETYEKILEWRERHPNKHAIGIKTFDLYLPSFSKKEFTIHFKNDTEYMEFALLWT